MDVQRGRATFVHLPYWVATIAGKSALVGGEWKERAGPEDPDSDWWTEIRRSRAPEHPGDHRIVGCQLVARPAAPQRVQDRHYRRGPGGVAAMGRHKRDVQLRRRNLSQRWIWGKRYATQYHSHRCDRA